VPVLQRVALGADGALPTPAPALPARLALVAAGGLLALTPALAGHPAAQSPRGLLTALDLLHVVAMSAWLGGLAFLLGAVPAATRRLQAPDRSRLLAGTLARFSPVALVSVAVLLATGVAQAWIHLDAFGDLVDSAFGRAVAVKSALAITLVGLGAVQRRRVMPALRRVAAGGEPPGAAGRLLRRTLRAEVALLVVVLAVTGVLTSTSPPGATAAGPYSATKRLGPLTLEAVVDPARPGVNEAHFYVLRARDGAPLAGLRELRVRASLPARGIEPLPVTVRTAGPGHVIAPGLPLSPAGTWHVEVTARISDFDEYRTVLRVPVR
jgi:copper transport protein